MAKPPPLHTSSNTGLLNLEALEVSMSTCPNIFVCLCARVCMDRHGACCTSFSTPLTPLHHFPTWHGSPAPTPPPHAHSQSGEEVQLTWLPEASFPRLLPAENGLQPPELVEVREATHPTQHDWKQRQGTLCRPAPRPTSSLSPRPPWCHLLERSSTRRWALNTVVGASLVVQWIGVCLPMQETPV